MPIEVIIMMIGMGLAKKKEGEQKAKEDELKDAGLFIKPQIS